MAKTRVLIIDDSAMVRQILTKILQTDRTIEVVDAASDPYIAREKIKQLHPDVLTLDVEMPRMDGLTFLANLMRLHPLPVVMISSLTEKGAEVTLRALELGAVDVVSKPKLDVRQGLQEYADEIIAKVKMAHTARLHPRESASKNGITKRSATTTAPKASGKTSFKTTDLIIAVGASTGGTEAIRQLLNHMPAHAPAMVITQHIPEMFSAPFAQRMDGISAMTVCEAQDRQSILPGHVYIAPGNSHLRVVRNGARYVCRLDNGPPVNRHRPSVDVMFHSIAQNVGANAIGVILTGMGADGAQSLKEMHDAGALSIAQDEKTSVVWGMPGEAVKQGGVDDILPLDKIAGRIMRLVER